MQTSYWKSHPQGHKKPFWKTSIAESGSEALWPSGPLHPQRNYQVKPFNTFHWLGAPHVVSPWHLLGDLIGHFTLCFTGRLWLDFSTFAWPLIMIVGCRTCPIIEQLTLFKSAGKQSLSLNMNWNNIYLYFFACFVGLCFCVFWERYTAWHFKWWMWQKVL